jgi:uncharacterized membrane protein YqjE
MNEDLSEVLRRLALRGVEHAHSRLELLRVEVADERERLGDLLLYGLGAAFFAHLSLQLLGLFFVVLLWDTPWRVHAAGVAVMLAVAGTLAFAQVFRRRRARRSELFRDSVDQLAKDQQVLDGLR